jgi:hypothetical protein
MPPAIRLTVRSRRGSRYQIRWRRLARRTRLGSIRRCRAFIRRWASRAARCTARLYRRRKRPIELAAFDLKASTLRTTSASGVRGLATVPPVVLIPLQRSTFGETLVTLILGRALGAPRRSRPSGRPRQAGARAGRRMRSSSGEVLTQLVWMRVGWEAIR